jgi:hypothetical protein
VSTTPTPFEREPVVMEKVSRAELLSMLRGLINQNYMPSANGSVKFNRKPEYIRHWMKLMPPFWPSVCESDTTDFLAFDQYGDFPGVLTNPPKAIYLFINVAPIFIIVRLDIDQVVVAYKQEGQHLAFFPWDGDEQDVAIDWFKLQQELDSYV